MLKQPALATISAVCLLVTCSHLKLLLTAKLGASVPAAAAPRWSLASPVRGLNHVHTKFLRVLESMSGNLQQIFVDLLPLS